MPFSCAGHSTARPVSTCRGSVASVSPLLREPEGQEPPQNGLIKAAQTVFNGLQALFLFLQLAVEDVLHLVVVLAAKISPRADPQLIAHKIEQPARQGHVLHLSTRDAEST